MRCCENCFEDEATRKLIAGLSDGAVGVCDFCGSEDVRVLEVAPESELANQFSDLLSVFAVASSEDTDSYGTLYEAFYETWFVFGGIAHETFNRLVGSMFPEDQHVSSLLSEKVRLDPSRTPEDPYELAFFGSDDWKSFAEEVKYRHRYHPKVYNRDVLKKLLGALSVSINPKDGLWYRARNWNGRTVEELTEGKLKEPPEGRSSEGRMSPHGVKCLYIANSPEGAIAEIRAAKHDDVAVMEMALSRTLRILDLSRIDSISPFDENVDCRELASNLKNLRQMKEALVKPMRSFDDELDYVPTQYIADYARSIGFDGIGYDSVLYETDDGRPSYNIASFVGFDEAFTCSELLLYHIDQNKYEPSKRYSSSLSCRTRGITPCVRNVRMIVDYCDSCHHCQ